MKNINIAVIFAALSLSGLSHAYPKTLLVKNNAGHSIAFKLTDINPKGWGPNYLLTNNSTTCRKAGIER